MTEAEKYKKIKELYFSESKEDIDLAIDWLSSLIGEENSLANLFVLNFYRDWESDEDIIVDDLNYAKKVFKTFSISFGKNYMYAVTFTAYFKGEQIIDSYNEYSRYRVGDGQPKYDFCTKITRWLRSNGYQLVNELFK